MSLQIPMSIVHTPEEKNNVFYESVHQISIFEKLIVHYRTEKRSLISLKKLTKIDQKKI